MSTLDVTASYVQGSITITPASELGLGAVSGYTPTEVTLAAPTEVTIEVSLAPVAAGPAGPAGPAGAANLGGYNAVFTSPQPGDLIAFGSGVWINTAQSTVTDGGNF